MDNITIHGDGMKLRRFESIVLIFNGCFSLLLSVTICLLNIVLIAATTKFPIRPERPLDKIHNAYFYASLMASIMFLPYFGVTEILHGLEITTGIRFPSYLSSTFLVFAQTNVQVSLFIAIERCAAFVSPHLHLRLTTRRKAVIPLFAMESFLLLFVCLSFTGINEQVFFTIYIHLFFSLPMSLQIITTGFTYWKIKTRKRIAISNEIPQSVEKLELHRKLSTRTARKYLTVVSLFLVPLILCILPWYIVKVSELTDRNAILTTNMGFFWQRLSISLVFLPDVLGPITLTIRFEAYYNSVKRFFRG